jgi:hypothetical protein
MKKFFFLFALAVMAACNQTPVNELTITGTINNPSDSMVEVFYYKDMIANKTEKVEATLDENNSFSVTLPLDEARNSFLSANPGAPSGLPGPWFFGECLV